MKLLHLALLATFTITAYAADEAFPPELAAARVRYEAAMAAATKPVRDKYVMELQQMKGRAMTAKNLELAIAIDQEIKTASGATIPGKTSEAGKSLADVLPGTKWVPERPGTKWKALEFGTEGKVDLVPLAGNTASLSYQIAKDGKTVTFSGGTVLFSRGNRQFVFQGAQFKQAHDQ